MKKLFALILMFPTVSVAGGTVFNARLVHVINAGTYILDVQLDGQSKRMQVSLPGIVLPALYGSPCERRQALQAKAFAEEVLWPNERIRVSQLHIEESRMYAEIEFEGRSMSQLLLKFKQALPDSAEPDWCERRAQTEHTGTSPLP